MVLAHLHLNKLEVTVDKIKPLPMEDANVIVEVLNFQEDNVLDASQVSLNLLQVVFPVLVIVFHVGV